MQGASAGRNATAPYRLIDLEAVRRQASLGFSLCLWLLVPIVAVLARSNGLRPGPVTLLEVAAALAATAGWRFGRDALWGRLAVSAALTFGPICLVWAGSGAWQIDYHMTFFVVFAALAAYVDWRPIALSAALTASHHLILDLVARDVVFPEEGLGRVALHGAVVVVACSVLFWIVFQMRALFAESRRCLESAESALDRLRVFEAAITESKDSILIARSEDFDNRLFRIVYVNPALESLTGYAPGELIGKPSEIFRGPQTDPSKTDLLHEAAIQGIRRVVDIVYHARDGSEIQCETSAHGIVDKAGQMSYLVSITRDIATRKATEAALVEAARMEYENNSELRREIARREEVEQELLHAAFHDQLTGLPNRTLFCERLKHAVTRSLTRGSRHVAVLFLDCDRFKFINDSFGHTTGDLLLNALARRLEECLRVGDTLARLGGDEFTILLEDIADADTARALAERVLTVFAAPFSLGGRELFATASIGVAVNELGSESADDLLRNADIAMYRAKAEGKGRHRLFRPELAEGAMRRLEVETALRCAVDRDELSVHYQGIVALDDCRLVGFEALLRWHHPRLGVISPAEFIPIAEETGLIGPIGGWVMREACRQMRRWQTTIPGARELAINVNVSAAQLLDEAFIAATRLVLIETELPPHTLHVEITESVLMTDPDRVAMVLAAVRDLGVELHLDDFGTGYSSLAYLHRFPVNALKIDKSFVSGAGHGLANPEIVETVIALARQLNLSVTAEGVETHEQVQQLRSLNCCRAQGFLFSKPRDATTASAYLLEALQAEPIG